MFVLIFVIFFFFFFWSFFFFFFDFFNKVFSWFLNNNFFFRLKVFFKSIYMYIYLYIRSWITNLYLHNVLNFFFKPICFFFQLLLDFFHFFFFDFFLGRFLFFFFYLIFGFFLGTFFLYLFFFFYIIIFVFLSREFFLFKLIIVIKQIIFYFFRFSKLYLKLVFFYFLFLFILSFFIFVFILVLNYFGVAGYELWIFVFIFIFWVFMSFFFFWFFIFFFFLFTIVIFFKVCFVDFFYNYFNNYSNFNKLSIKKFHIIFVYYISKYIIWYESIVFNFFSNFVRFFSFQFFFFTLYKLYVPRNYVINEIIAWLRDFSIEVKAEDDPENYVIYRFFFDNIFTYLSDSVQFKFRNFFNIIIYCQYTLIYYFFFIKYSIYFYYVCWTQYRFWILAAFQLWFFIELIFIGYCIDCIKLKIVKFYYRKTAFFRISKRKKRFFRFFWFSFSDYFFFLESFLKYLYKIRLWILNSINKNYKYREEILKTVVWHLELFNRRINIVNNQITMAQRYIDFFEQRAIILKFFKKENLTIRVKLFKNKLKFKNLEQVIVYKKSRELKMARLLRARKYFLRAGNVLSRIERPIPFEMKVRCSKDKNRTVNSLMRSFFIKKLKIFFLRVISFSLVTGFDFLKFFYRMSFAFLNLILENKVFFFSFFFLFILVFFIFFFF